MAIERADYARYYRIEEQNGGAVLIFSPPPERPDATTLAKMTVSTAQKVCQFIERLLQDVAIRHVENSLSFFSRLLLIAQVIKKVNQIEERWGREDQVARLTLVAKLVSGLIKILLSALNGVQLVKTSKSERLICLQGGASAVSELISHLLLALDVWKDLKKLSGPDVNLPSLYLHLALSGLKVIQLTMRVMAAESKGYLAILAVATLVGSYFHIWLKMRESAREQVILLS